MLNIKQGPSFEEQKKHTTGGVGCNIDEHLNSSEQKIAFGGPITLLLVISTHKNSEHSPFLLAGFTFFGARSLAAKLSNFCTILRITNGNNYNK